MNNEPVAWIWSEDGCNMGVCLDQDKQIGKQEFQDYSIPLYTHPANPYQSITDTKIEPTVVSYTHPTKEYFEDEPQAEELHEIMQSNAELTDEEIIKVYQSLWKFLPAEEPRLAKDIKEFARAILRKASEK